MSFSRLDQGYGLWGGRPQRWSTLFTISYKIRACAVSMLYDCWCCPGSPGQGRVCRSLPSPFRAALLRGSLLFLLLSVKLICEAEWGQGCCWYHTRLSSSEVLLGWHCLFAFCLVSKSQTSLSFLLGKQGQHSEMCRGPHFTKNTVPRAVRSSSLLPICPKNSL